MSLWAQENNTVLNERFRSPFSCATSASRPHVLLPRRLTWEGFACVEKSFESVALGVAVDPRLRISRLFSQLSDKKPSAAGSLHTRAS